MRRLLLYVCNLCTLLCCISKQAAEASTISLSLAAYGNSTLVIDDALSLVAQSTIAVQQSCSVTASILPVADAISVLPAVGSAINILDMGPFLQTGFNISTSSCGVSFTLVYNVPATVSDGLTPFLSFTSANHTRLAYFDSSCNCLRILTGTGFPALVTRGIPTEVLLLLFAPYNVAEPIRIFDRVS